MDWIVILGSGALTSCLRLRGLYNAPPPKRRDGVEFRAQKSNEQSKAKEEDKKHSRVSDVGDERICWCV